MIVSTLHSNYYICRIGHNSPSSGTETEFKSKRRSQISTSSSSVPADGSTHGSTPTPPPLPERTDSLNNRSEEAELRKAPWFQAGIPRYLIHTLDNSRNIILEIFPGNYGFIKIIDMYVCDSKQDVSLIQTFLIQCIRNIIRKYERTTILILIFNYYTIYMFVIWYVDIRVSRRIYFLTRLDLLSFCVLVWYA